MMLGAPEYQRTPARDRAVKRSLTWLAAYSAENSGSFAEAAALYNQVAAMHDEAGMPINAQHYREHAKDLWRVRAQANKALEDSSKT